MLVDRRLIDCRRVDMIRALSCRNIRSIISLLIMGKLDDFSLFQLINMEQLVVTGIFEFEYLHKDRSIDLWYFRHDIVNINPCKSTLIEMLHLLISVVELRLEPEVIESLGEVNRQKSQNIFDRWLNSNRVTASPLPRKVVTL